MAIKQNAGNESPIDAVIPWVDGADPKHKARLEAYLASIGGARPRSASPSRFHNSNEIEYCVVSLLRFASWIRTIYIVTDQQIPELIHKLKGTVYESRVRVIDHKAIFAGYEDCLPTFNSSTILTMLWRIPGLAEQFLFLNDDFALIRPVQPRDFFCENGVVLRGNWRKFSDKSFGKRLVNFLRSLIYGSQPKEKIRVGYIAAQEVSAKIVNFSDRYFQVPHNPHAWRVSTFRDFFEDHPEILKFNIGFRLRSPEQFIGEALSAHLELKKSAGVIDDKLSTLQLKPADQSEFRIKFKLFNADRDSSIAFVCVQNLENASEEKQKIVMAWLNRRVGLLSDLV
ncbi:MAG: hypothetical protein K0Q78_1627 [Cellvibrio sp.]|nr:hypothetical protein [Cellvibrio sp.]